MMFNSSLGSDVALLPGVNVALYVHLLSILGGCLGYAAIMLAARFGHLGVLPRRATVGACVLVQSASSALCHIFGYSLALTGTLSAIGGVAAAFPLVAWAELYAGLGKRELVGYSAASFLLSAVICGVCSALGASVEFAALVASPIGMFLMLPRDRADARAAAEPTIQLDASGGEGSSQRRVDRQGPQGQHGRLWKALVTLGAFMLVIGVMRVGSGNFFAALSNADEAAGLAASAGGAASVLPARTGSLAPDVAQLAFQVVTMGVLVWYAWGSSRPSIRLGWFYKSAILLVVIVVTLILDLAENVGLTWLNVAAECCASVVEVCGWVLLIDVARSSLRRVAEVVSLGRLVVHVALGGGTLTALWLGQGELVSLLGAFVVVLVAAGLFLLDAGSSPVLFDIDVAPESFVESNPHALPHQVHVRAEEFAQAYRFTAREREVFALWITSHGLKQIQEDLGMSESTLKTHIRHIYGKCEVHSRSELVDMLEEFAGH